MRRLRILWSRLLGLLTGRARDADLRHEIAAHLHEAADEFRRRGLSPEAAKREALRGFGGVVQTEELHREARSFRWLEDLATRDLRYAIRGLRATPTFTGVALVVLMLGVGVSTAVFSVVDAVILRGLPFGDPDRLVAVGTAPPPQATVRVAGSVTPQDFADWRAHSSAFETLAATSAATITLRAAGDARPVALVGQRVTSNLFQALRVQPVLGRAFALDEEVAGRDRVTVISYTFWQQYFAGAADVLGRRIPADGGDLEVVGVMPPGFAYPVWASKPTDVWVPYVAAADERVRSNSRSSYLHVVGRLKDGISATQAQASIDEVNAGIAADNPKWFQGRFGTVLVQDFRTNLVGRARNWMLMLLGGVAFVLLLTCVNVANLMLVRSTTRVRELGIRAALGATSGTLLRQLLIEGCVLSIAGTALGILVAWWGIDVLRAAIPADLPHVGAIGLNLRLLGVACAVALFTGIAFGLTPALHVSRLRPNDAVRHTGQSAAPRWQRLRTVLLVTEIAIAVVLAVASGLFFASFARVTNVDLGFDHRNVLTVPIAPRVTFSDVGERNATLARVTPALLNIIDRLRDVRGIEVAAASDMSVPLSGAASGAGLQRAGYEPTNVGFSQVSPDYFTAIRVPLVRGRFFTAGDRFDGEPVLILNQVAATRIFGEADPIGQTVTLNGARTIVGIVGDMRPIGPEGAARPAAFLPMAQSRMLNGALVLRTSGDLAAIVPAIKAAVWSELPDVAIPDMETLDRSLRRLLARREFNMLLVGVFGLLGVTIAAVGIYGVMAYVVTQRTREIGVRMALGAAPDRVVWSIMGRAAAYVGMGLGLGLACVWPLARFVETFLFKVEPHDLIVYAAACAVLSAAGLVAAWVPARRAARVDPLLALRTE